MKNQLEGSRKEVMKTFRNNANVEIVKTADNLINMQFSSVHQQVGTWNETDKRNSQGKEIIKVIE